MSDHETPGYYETPGDWFLVSFAGVYMLVNVKPIIGLARAP